MKGIERLENGQATYAYDNFREDKDYEYRNKVTRQAPPKEQR